jgi:hypothetical protein
MAPDVVRLEEGRMSVYSPLPPGERYLMVRYGIPEDEFVLPLPGETDRMEVLVREPGPEAEFPPLFPTSSVELEPGNSFRRYAGDSLADAEIRAEVSPDPWSLPPEWVGILMASLLAAAGVVGYRLRSRSTARAAEEHQTNSLRNRLLMEVAELDEEYQTLVAPSAEAQEDYQAARDRLLARLKGLS